MDIEQLRQALRDGTLVPESPVKAVLEASKIATTPAPDGQTPELPQRILDRVVYNNNGMVDINKDTVKLRRRSELRFRKGTSDKVYKVLAIQHSDHRCAVYTEWGKSKQSPVTRQWQMKDRDISLFEADKMVNKIVQEKLKKGYSVVGESK